MEDNCDLEVIRLKRLLEDRLLQVEKENMELIKNGYSVHCVQSKNTHGHKDKLEIYSTPLSPTSNKEACNCCTKHSQLAKTNIRSCPHFKMHLCKKYSDAEINTENPHSNIHFLNHLEASMQVDSLKRRVLQNESKSKYTPCAVPLSPPIRIKKEDNMPNSVQSHSELLTDSRISYSLCSLPQRKKLVMQRLPDVTIKEENINKISSIEGKKNEKASQLILPVKKDFPQTFSPDAKSRFRSLEVSSTSKKLENSFSSAISSPKHSQGFSVPDSNSINIAQSTNMNHGLNLQISLDSCSTKDLVSKILQKISDLISENQVTITSTNKDDKETQQYETQNIINIPNDVVDQAQAHVSTSMQTELAMEQSVNQHVLHDFVKRIVLDILKDAQISKPIFLAKETLPLSHKINSDIHYEEHNIVNSSKVSNIEDCRKDILLNEENNLQLKNLLSKGVQTSMNLAQTVNKQVFYDENINMENPHSLVENFNSNLMNEEINTSLDKFQKVELMLEKIYENVCKRTEVVNNDIIPPDHSIITREVAVQFNPLQTSTKSTLTSEIKTTDSYCQYDIQSNINSAFNSYTDASVQTIDCANYCTPCQALLNAYTQSEKKIFFDVGVQTEMFSFEHSAINTSVSSTPVSDNMFMDDLLSEGEMALPWNLRLISLSDKGGAININTTDSSDVSIKDKDYSLSEGEIHPNIVHYLNVCHHNPREDDQRHDISVPNLVRDPSTQNVFKDDSEMYASHHLICNQNSQNQQFGSSLSEGEINYNEYLTFGEVSP